MSEERNRRRRESRAWNRRYDEAVQWRDWQTCDQLLEERDRSDWYRSPASSTAPEAQPENG